MIGRRADNTPLVNITCRDTVPSPAKLIDADDMMKDIDVEFDVATKRC